MQTPWCGGHVAQCPALPAVPYVLCCIQLWFSPRLSCPSYWRNTFPHTGKGAAACTCCVWPCRRGGPLQLHRSQEPGPPRTHMRRRCEPSMQAVRVTCGPLCRPSASLVANRRREGGPLVCRRPGLKRHRSRSRSLLAFDPWSVGGGCVTSRCIPAPQLRALRYGLTGSVLQAERRWNPEHGSRALGSQGHSAGPRG